MYKRCVAMVECSFQNAVRDNWFDWHVIIHARVKIVYTYSNLKILIILLQAKL